jgi:hypothetical protein
VFDVGASFVINSNERRIPIGEILKSCREQLQAAHVPEADRPDLSDSKRLPILPLPAWRLVMQMDQNSTTLPANFHMHFDESKNLLQMDLPTSSAIPVTPASASDDFDLLGQRIRHDDAHAGAIEHLHTGIQAIPLSPLPAVSRSAAAKSGAGKAP